MGTGVVGRVVDAIDIGDEDALPGHLNTDHFPWRQVAGFRNWEKFVGHGGDDNQVRSGIVGLRCAQPNLRRAVLDGGDRGADGITFDGLEAATVTVADQITAEGYERVLGPGPAIAAGGIVLRAVTGQHDVFQPDLDFIATGIDAAGPFRPVSGDGRIAQLEMTRFVLRHQEDSAASIAAFIAAQCDIGEGDGAYVAHEYAATCEYCGVVEDAAAGYLETCIGRVAKINGSANEGVVFRQKHILEYHGTKVGARVKGATHSSQVPLDRRVRNGESLPEMVDATGSRDGRDDSHSVRERECANAHIRGSVGNRNEGSGVPAVSIEDGPISARTSQGETLVDEY